MTTVAYDENVRHSFCEACGDSITIRLADGQRWPDASWNHDGGPLQDADHTPVPELRFAIDATCPSCKYPEIGFAPAREEFVCSRCGHTQTTRPKG
jgi:ribosomal protein S27E